MLPCRSSLLVRRSRLSSRCGRAIEPADLRIGALLELGELAPPVGGIWCLWSPCGMIPASRTISVAGRVIYRDMTMAPADPRIGARDDNRDMREDRFGKGSLQRCGVVCEFDDPGGIRGMVAKGGADGEILALLSNPSDPDVLLPGYPLLYDGRCTPIHGSGGIVHQSPRVVENPDIDETGIVGRGLAEHLPSPNPRSFLLEYRSGRAEPEVLRVIRCRLAGILAEAAEVSTPIPSGTIPPQADSFQVCVRGGVLAEGRAPPGLEGGELEDAGGVDDIQVHRACDSRLATIVSSIGAFTFSGSVFDGPPPRLFMLLHEGEKSLFPPAVERRSVGQTGGVDRVHGIDAGTPVCASNKRPSGSG